MEVTKQIHGNVGKRGRNMSFFSTACKPVADVRTFLKEAAGNFGLKLSAEKGAIHHIYFPARTVVKYDEAGNAVEDKTLCAIAGKVHSLRLPGQKFREVMCLKDIVRTADDGTMINDGSCPFCDRVADSNAIFFYRRDIEDKRCQLQGDDRKKYLENVSKTLGDEKKVLDERLYMYTIVAKFKDTADGSAVLGKDGLPEYELKVMRLSGSRLQDFEKILKNAGVGIYDAELKIEYPNSDDKRLLVSQSTVSPIFEAAKFVSQYPAVKDKIAKEVEEFNWEGIAKAFPEWEGASVAEALKITSEQFEQWDKYQNELKTNPNALYLEYQTSTAMQNPSLSVAQATNGMMIGNGQQVGGAVMPTMPTMPTMPNMGAMQMPNMGAVQMPTMSAVGGMQMPGVTTIPSQPVVGTGTVPSTPEATVNGAFADLNPKATI